jgi:hypothetical protein
VLFPGCGNFREFKGKLGRHIFLPTGEVEQANDLPEHVFLGAGGCVFLRLLVLQSVNPLLHQRRADGDYWQHKCLGELTEPNFEVVHMDCRATRAPPVGNEFRDDFGHGFAGHVGRMLLFVELPHFGEGDSLWQTRAGYGVVAHDFHQPGGTGIADAFIFGQQREGLFK